MALVKKFLIPTNNKSMQEEKVIQELFKDHEKMRDDVSNYFGDVRIDNIRQIRDLVKHLIIISSAIIGFTLPIFGSSNIVKYPIFLIAGLFALLIVVLYGFLYLKNVLESDSKGLYEQHKKYNKMHDKLRDSVINFLISQKTEEDFNKKFKADKEALDEFPAEIPQKKGRALDIIFLAFFIALILIVLSMLDTSWLLNLMLKFGFNVELPKCLVFRLTI